ncbi:lumen HSP seventy [Scheffersomyces xylosifermentans]|uniref:lumen HSP seventy n=1 Tax=Scheffersomyces xylosifermentans TaxID=1304137 RepID=UPI00315D7678
MRFAFFWTCLITMVSAAILGLDYGQKFTKAVLLAPGINFEMVLTDEGKRKDLSGVSIRSHKNEIERVYGSQIGSLCTRFPQSCILDIKPLLGKSIDDQVVKEYLSTHYGVKLIGDDSRNGAIKFDLGFTNQSYIFTVEEILAMHLNEIKARALDDLEANPVAIPLAEDVAIGIPPFATQETKQAYLDALKLANFSNVLGLIEEGTSVALNFLSKKKFEKPDYNDIKQYHIVYDMGAGSTVATLFSFTPYTNGSVVLELENVAYDETFGGQLLTNSIYSIILEKLLKHFNLKENDLTPKLSAKLAEVSEKAKLILSVNNEYKVSLESIIDDKDFKTSISRDEFEEFNSDLMQRITAPVLEVVKGSGLSLDDVKSVILNGGSTRVPFVQKHLTTLITEEKISKSVNTDESCALGVALRGLKLKTQFEKATEIKIIEKNFNNYEIVTDNSNDLQVVFPRGSTINEISRFSLGKLNDTVTINLYENDKLFKTYNVEDLLSKAKKLSCKSKEIKEVFATFKLDNSKIFDLTNLEIQCVHYEEKKGFFQNLLKKEETGSEDEEVTETIEEEDSSNNATNKTAKVVTKRATRPVSIPLPKAVYTHVKPLSRTTQERLADKLAYLNAKDEEKIKYDHTKNILEGQCYNLRSYIEEQESKLLEELSEDYLQEQNQFISDTLEWLEFDSDGASIEQIEEKVYELSNRKKELEDIAEISSTDLSFAGVTKLYEQSTKIIMTIQSHMMEFGSQISEIRQKYENQSLDFDKENDRIKLHLLSKGDDKMIRFDKNLAQYKEDVTAVGDLLNAGEEEFAKLSKREVYSYYDKLAKRIIEMLSDIYDVEASHKERIKLFNSKYEALLRRRKQKELRKKLKEEQKAKKAEEADLEEENNEEEAAAAIIEEDEDEQEVPISTEEKSEPVVESEFSEDPIVENIEHDEL